MNNAENQKRALAWCYEMFGSQTTENKRERALSFVEEAIELAQASGLDLADVRGLVDYVMSRPKGEPAQEVGGVMLTLYTLCGALDLDAGRSFLLEMRRVEAPGFKAKLLKRQAEKRAAGVATCSGEEKGQNIKRVAELLANEHMREGSSILRVYWIKHEAEVRLIEITEEIPARGEILPFRFAADPPDIPYKSLIILLHPQDWERRADLDWPPEINPMTNDVELICSGEES